MVGEAPPKTTIAFLESGLYNQITMKKKSKKKMNIALIVLGILFLAWVAYGYFSVALTEQLQYEVLDQSKEYEIRQYDDYLIAETKLDGSFEKGGDSAFRIVAGYIFGGNTKKEKIAMTAPVVEAESEKIAMTTPVVFDDEAENKTFAFVLPAKYTLETLPEPNDKRVEIKAVKGSKVAVLRFSGLYRDKKFQAKKEELISYLERDGLKYGQISTAGYNPPWTPPFMNRIEVWATLTE